MKAWKSLALIFLLVLSIHAVAAQGLSGANMTVEESLVTFVSEVLGVSVTSASDVLLYLVAPIIGFYFLISNFGKEGYNAFQDRLERREHISSEEDLPTGMKLFSLVTSFITVVSVGRIAPSLILIIGGLAFLLGLLTFLNLFNFGDNNNGDGGGDDGGNDGNNDDNGGGATRGDYIDRIGDATHDIREGIDDWTEERHDNDRIEAFRYFDSDFASEVNQALNELSDIHNLESDARDQLSEYDRKSGNDFKSAVTRSLHIKERAEEYERKLNNDVSVGATNYAPSDSSLCNTVENNINNNEDIHSMINALYNQLSRIESEDPISPPMDVFDELMDRMIHIIRLGHFLHYYPEDMSEIALDNGQASELVETASSLGLSNDPNNSNVNSAMNLASALDNRENQILGLVKNLEELSKAEMKFSESEVNSIKNIVEVNGDVHDTVQDILSAYNSHYGSGSKIGDHKPRFIQSDNLIRNEINQLLSQLQSRVDSDKDIEMKTYRQLKQLEDKI